MKKRWLALLLTFVMLLSLSVPALAAETRETHFFEAQEHGDVNFEDMEYVPIDADAATAAMDATRALAEDEANTDAVREGFLAACDLYTNALTMYTLANIHSSQDYANPQYIQDKSEALEADNKMLRESNISLKMQAQQVENLQKEAAKAVEKAKKAEAARDDSVKELQEARAELAEAKAKPAIPADVIEKMQTEAREAAEKETAEALEREAQLRQQAEKETEELRRKLAVASPEVATYKTYFTMFQEDFNRLHGFLLKIGNTDAETAAKLKKALATVVDSFRDKLKE